MNVENYCDLHAHTIASDGSFTPTELIRYAKEKGLGAIAVTDHDTVDGLEEAIACGNAIGQKVIPGIEMTTKLEGCEIHIVGLFVDHTKRSFVERVKEIAKSRDQRNYDMVHKLQEHGFAISMSDLERYEGHILTKAHIGAILIERGYGTELREVVNKYLAKGCVGYVERVTPEPQECLTLIHEAGGLAFVAHTNQIDRKDRDHSVEICKQILQMGADGLETRYCEFDEDWVKRTETLAETYQCLRSGGSDFHGTYKKNLDLKTGYGDLKVPYEYVQQMEMRLKK